MKILKWVLFVLLYITLLTIWIYLISLINMEKVEHKLTFSLSIVLIGFFMGCGYSSFLGKILKLF